MHNISSIYTYGIITPLHENGNCKFENSGRQRLYSEPFCKFGRFAACSAFFYGFFRDKKLLPEAESRKLYDQK